jgi:hypothetical protein
VVRIVLVILPETVALTLIDAIVPSWGATKCERQAGLDACVGGETSMKSARGEFAAYAIGLW